MKKLLIMSVSLFALLFFSCSSDDDPVETPTNNVTYKENIKAIMDVNCISCHASTPINGAPMALVTLQDVKEAIENRDLIGRVANGSMPQGDNNLSAEQIKLIEDWEKNNFK